ncbi:MAG: hypothetical protein ACTSUC_09870 [Promethearchaeota archaeon]
MKEGKKIDLEKVLCDKILCSERGERARCYEGSFNECPIYMGDKKYLSRFKNGRT